MKNLDLKDRKILYHLDINSRQSFSQLGKKVGLHKDVVAYRVKKLQEKGVIKCFYTEIDDYITNNPLKQIVTACGEGAVAANSVHKELIGVK